MGEWLQSLPVGWMALVVFTLSYLVAWAIFAVVRLFAAGERLRGFKAVSPGMLPPLGIIFGLLVAFVASQVWNDMDHAKAAVNREASNLSTVLFLAASFPGEPETQMRELTRRHIQEAVSYEWPKMAQLSASLAVTPAALAEELQLVLSLVPRSQGQVTAQREIVAALEEAIDARRQRIVVSRSSVNWVKWTALLLQAVCTLTAIAMIHVDNRAAAAAAMGIFATGVAVAVVLIASHDRPFTGEISVKPDLLERIIPEEAVTQEAVDHSVLLHLTTLLRCARQVITDRPHLTGKELIEEASAKYAEQTGHPVPSLDPTSTEGQMLQAEMDAMREVMDELNGASGSAPRGSPQAAFVWRAAERFNRKVGTLAYMKMTAPAELIRHPPNAPDAWEGRTIGNKLQAKGWKKGESVEEEAGLNGRKAWRVLIPEYYETSCLECHSGKAGALGGAVSAAIYLK
jgi:hypothetical protein